MPHKILKFDFIISPCYRMIREGNLTGCTMDWLIIKVEVVVDVVVYDEEVETSINNRGL